MEILAGFSPKVEQLSIDEAFLDCTGTGGLFGDPARLGGRIREAIHRGTGLTASVGIAGNKSVAKIASDRCKPDGLMLCPPGREREFLAPLPISCLWGAGEKTRRRLERLGYRTVGDLAAEEREKLSARLGAWGGRLWELANGMDDRPVEGSEARKSISEETTFGEDTGDRRRIEGVLFAIADRLTGRMRAEGYLARTVTLKIRLEGFQNHTRSRTLDRHVDDTAAVRDTCVALFRAFDTGGCRVRLVGIGLSNLRAADAGGQLDLFGGGHPPEEDEEAGRTDRVLDMMRRLYGDKVTRGAFLPPRSDGGG
jgi:DNA polymerase-4